MDLPSGGYLMIDYAEAMTVIDINSGSFTGRGKGAKLEDTITKTNLEAADEVVRQLRLRDIGGIIVIDFIDMARARNRDAVLKTLRKSLDEDRTKTYVVEISPLGLVEMTRQNVTDGVREILTKTCPTCDGEGVVLSEETVAIEAERWLRELAVERPEPEAFLIRVNPKVAANLVGDGHGGPGPLLEIERETGKHFHFEGTEALPIDYFEVVARGLGATRSRSARCRSGRARRCSSRSKSRTCTTRTTRSPSSTATSSRCRARPRSWASDAGADRQGRTLGGGRVAGQPAAVGERRGIGRRRRHRQRRRTAAPARQARRPAAPQGPHRDAQLARSLDM